MNNPYRILQHQPVIAGTYVSQNGTTDEVKISPQDTAFSMMTDFNHVRPFSTTMTSTIGEINQKMIDCGVRLLFVADNHNALHGLITYNDIYGDKPVRYLQENGGKREEISAQNIMTPLVQLEAIEVTDILKARIGDIVETMKSTGRQHILVIESREDGSQALSGLFSSTQIENRLGVKIEISPRANTFADLERALA